MCCHVGDAVDDEVGELINKSDFDGARTYVFALGEDITSSQRRKLLKQIQDAYEAFRTRLLSSPTL